MLSTATHDTKRGEDVRMRLVTLAETPEEWSRNVTLWRGMVARESESLDDRNLEYLLFQTLVGTWPVSGMSDDEQASYQARIHAAVVKAAREARVNTSWAAPQQGFELALATLLDAIFASVPLRTELHEFALGVAEAGARNSLVQLTLKLTTPGVPDIYQGTELWDLNLVDPDNRRPVDFARREALLAQTVESWQRDPLATCERLAADWHDGAIKMLLTAVLLGHRREHPLLYSQGAYRAWEVPAPFGAFLRESPQDALLVIFARYPRSTAAGRVQLPRAAAAWRSVFTGQPLEQELQFSAGSAGLPVIVATRG
jgi:(1->4)-alpha-D-glucan 1-alpha-D-glucosylmutase